MQPPNTRKSILRRFGHRVYRLCRSIVVIQDSPHRIAWGVAIGTFVAYLPIVGIQMIVGAIMCKLMRANILASIPMAWITNPLTIVPIYFGLFLLGGLATGDTMTYTEMQTLIKQINEAGIWTMDGISQTIDLIGRIFLPLMIGGVVVGVINGVLFYMLTLKAVAAYQRRRSRRRLTWQKKHERASISGVEPEESAAAAGSEAESAVDAPGDEHR